MHIHAVQSPRALSAAEESTVSVLLPYRGKSLVVRRFKKFRLLIKLGLQLTVVDMLASGRLSRFGAVLPRLVKTEAGISLCRVARMGGVINEGKAQNGLTFTASGSRLARNFGILDEFVEFSSKFAGKMPEKRANKMPKTKPENSQGESYKEYLEIKEQLESNLRKTYSDLPSMESAALIKSLSEHRVYNVLDPKLLSGFERELRNRLSTMPDDLITKFIVELCKANHVFSETKFLERRVFKLLSESGNSDRLEQLPLLIALAGSGQRLSEDFPAAVVEAFEDFYSTIPEEERMQLLRIVALTYRGKEKLIPKRWLQELEQVNSIKQLLLSVDIVKAFKSYGYENKLVPDQYKQKVIEFSKNDLLFVTLIYNIKVIEIFEALDIGELGAATNRMIQFLKDDIPVMNYKNMVRGVNFLIGLLQRKPKYLNVVGQNLTQLRGDLVQYLDKNCELMSLDELLEVTNLYLDLSKLLRGMEKEHFPHIMKAIGEGHGLITPDVKLSYFKRYLQTLGTLIQSDFKEKLVRDEDFLISLNKMFNTALSFKLTENDYLEVVQSLTKIVLFMTETGYINNAQASEAMSGIVSRANLIQLSNFDSFVAVMSQLDELIDKLGEESTPKIQITREKLLDRYQGKKQ